MFLNSTLLGSIILKLLLLLLLFNYFFILQLKALASLVETTSDQRLLAVLAIQLQRRCGNFHFM